VEHVKTHTQVVVIGGGVLDLVLASTTRKHDLAESYQGRSIQFLLNDGVGRFTDVTETYHPDPEHNKYGNGTSWNIGEGQIVVYDEELESNVRIQYPVSPSENKDYLWIPLNQAIQYLDEEISKDILERTTASLKEIRMRLRNYFNIQAEIQ